MSKLVISILMGMLLLLLLVNNTESFALLDTVSHEQLALGGIHRAELAGADVSELISRFNDAIVNYKETGSSYSSACSSSSDCTQHADDMFVSIANDASILEDQAIKRQNLELLTSVLYSIIGAFVVAFIILSLYRLGKYYQLRRFLDMGVIVRQK